jgi:beta-lactam-binding protein with PASTA domain
MNSKLKQSLRRLSRIAFVVVLSAVVLFVLLDDVVMPAYVQQGKTTLVPNVVGQELADAREGIHKSGLVPIESEYKQDKQYPEGTIVQQNPLGGSEVKFGRGIYLTISGGEALIVVPNLRGRSVRDASFSLERFGLKIGNLEYQPSDTLFENTVIGQSPLPGAKIRSGNAVDLIVSQGKNADRIPVPSVLMKTLNEAEKFLTASGLTAGKITYQVSLDLLPNTVIEQYPRAGEFVSKERPIDLIVAQKADQRPKLEN